MLTVLKAARILSVVQTQIGLGAIRMGGDAGEKPPPTGVETDRVRMRGGRALRIAVSEDPRMAGQMPSTKGCL